MLSPCDKDCPERTAECKKTCPKYKPYAEFKQQEFKYKQKLFEQNMRYEEYREQAITRMKRGKKKRG